MEITITAKQFMELRMLPVQHPTDTGDDEIDLRNLPLHLQRLWEIIGRDTVCQALATGETVDIRVDWGK